MLYLESVHSVLLQVLHVAQIVANHVDLVPQQHQRKDAEAERREDLEHDYNQIERCGIDLGIPKPKLESRGEMAKKITGIAKKMKRNVFLVQLGVAEEAANDKIGTVEPQKTDTQERSEHFSDVDVEKEKEKVLLISSAYAVVYPAR